MSDQEAPPPPPSDQIGLDLDFALARIRELIAITQANAVLTVATSTLAERVGKEVAVLITGAGLNDGELMAIIERVRKARQGLLDTYGALTPHAE